MTAEATTSAPETETPQPRRRSLPSRAAPFGRFVRRRLLHAVIVLFIVSVFASLLVEIVPGDPAASLLGEDATPASLAIARKRLGIDKPLVQRYLHWVGNALHGNLGTSIRSGQQVSAAIKQRIPVTLELTVLAQLMALLIAFPLAIFLARRAGRRSDRVVEFGLSTFIAAPSFVVGVLLIYLLGVKWHVFPIVGWTPITKDLGDNLRHALLPAVTIALLEAATFTRVLKADLISTMNEDYILAARAKGISGRRLVVGHALRPSMFTLVTLGGLSFARILGGTVIVETLFTLPGLGRLVVDSVKFGDLPVVQGTVILIAAAYLVINMLVDMTYGWLDPRLRAGGRS
jgi:peptide/nickel transport system permease protein